MRSLGDSQRQCFLDVKGLLMRGGPVLTRGDLPGADALADDIHRAPRSDAVPEAHIEPLTDKGEWSWLEPTVPDYARGDEEEEELPSFVPYSLKAGSADYPLQMGPHTVLEGFYKFGLRESGSKHGELRTKKPPAAAKIAPASSSAPATVSG